MMQSVYSPSAIDNSLKLPSLGAEVGTTTISGISGGSYFASYVSVALSDQVAGVGHWLGGPFGERITKMTSTGSATKLANDGIAEARRLASKG
jgi:hypothetical protein